MKTAESPLKSRIPVPFVGDYYRRSVVTPEAAMVALHGERAAVDRRHLFREEGIFRTRGCLLNISAERYPESAVSLKELGRSEVMSAFGEKKLSPDSFGRVHSFGNIGVQGGFMLLTGMEQTISLLDMFGFLEYRCPTNWRMGETRRSLDGQMSFFRNESDVILASPQTAAGIARTIGIATGLVVSIPYATAVSTLSNACSQASRIFGGVSDVLIRTLTLDRFDRGVHHIAAFNPTGRYLQTGEEEFSGIINNDMLPFRFGAVLLDI